MYNDENGICITYTYRKDGSETTEKADARATVDAQINAYQAQGGYHQPVQEIEASEKESSWPENYGLGSVLCTAWRRCGRWDRLGGQPQWNEATVNMSGRPATSVSINQVDGKTLMTDAGGFTPPMSTAWCYQHHRDLRTQYFWAAGADGICRGSGFILNNRWLYRHQPPCD